MKTGIILTLIMTLAPIVGSPVMAKTWLVRADGSGDAPNIQAAIDSCANGDSVVCETGTYSGPGNYAINFSGKAIVLTSATAPEMTIIDCQGNGQGVIFDSGEGGGSVLAGMTIRNANTVGNGGAVFCDNASPEISNNLLINNTAANGGAIGLKKSSANIFSNTIADNSSGVFVQQGAPMLSHNIITLSTVGEAIKCTGGASPVLACNNLVANAGGDAVCGVDGGNNISVDSQFCGIPGSYNYYLQGDSPCEASNSPCGIQIGCLPAGCATVSTESSTWGALKRIYK